MKRQAFAYLIILISILSQSTACMRVDPDHPYDRESPPEYRAPASLVSAIYSSEVTRDFDYSDFVVQLLSTELEIVHTRRATETGSFRFEGIYPGVYLLSARGVIDGLPWGIDDQEIFLPVGEVTLQEVFLLQELID